MSDSRLKVCYMGMHFRTHIVQGKQERMVLGKTGKVHPAVEQSEKVGTEHLLDLGLVQ